MEQTVKVPEIIRGREVAVRGLAPHDERKLMKDLTIHYEQRVTKTRIVNRKYKAYTQIRPTEYLVPRGYEDHLPPHTLNRDRTVAPLMDRSVSPTATLRDHQLPVTGIHREFNSGLICAPTGSGKTVVGCVELICGYGVKTLVINKTKDLSEQWKSRILSTTDAEESQIGWIGSGKWNVADITVATWQTLSRRLDKMYIENRSAYDEFVKSFGLILFDEAHNVPAQKVHEVAAHFYARHLWGLTATPYRSDEFGPMIEYVIGPIRVHLEKPQNSVPISFNQIKIPGTKYPAADDWMELTNMMMEDQGRTDWITEHIAEHAPTPTLIICVRKKLVQDMRESLELLTDGVDIVELTGDTPRKEREDILERGYRGEYDYILSTTLANEGLDWPPLRSICLVFPGRYEGNVVQQTGRISRPSPGKNEAVVLDYVDAHGITRSQARARVGAYINEGYTRYRTEVK